MQIRKFSTGGYAIHKITILGIKGTISCWLDSHRNLLDAELIYPYTKGFGRQVLRDKNLWNRIQKLVRTLVLE